MATNKARIFVNSLSEEGTSSAFHPEGEHILQKDFELVSSRILESNPGLWDAIEGSVTWVPWEPEPPPRSVVVRASARGAGGRGSIPDRVTPQT